jgi:hypothetical protein
MQQGGGHINGMPPRAGTAKRINTCASRAPLNDQAQQNHPTGYQSVPPIQKVRPTQLPPFLSLPPKGALLSLCLLAQAYGHAADAVEALAQLDVGPDLLVQVFDRGLTGV